MQVGLLCLLPRLLLYSADCLSLLLAVDYLFVDDLGRVEVSAQVVVEVLGEEVADVRTN